MSFKRPELYSVLVLLTLSMAWASHASQEIIVPRMPGKPVIDGSVDEAAWMSAVESPVEPREHCQMRVGFDESALWFALQSEELRQGTLEIALRVTDCMEEQDRFIVDTYGNKQLIRQRIGSAPATDAWQAVAQQDRNTWSVEMRIPFETLGVQPVPGNVLRRVSSSVNPAKRRDRTSSFHASTLRYVICSPARISRIGHAGGTQKGMKLSTRKHLTGLA